jgi:hypothetical protein
MPRTPRSDDPMVTLNTRIRLSQRDWLDEYVESHNITLAEAVRRAIDALTAPAAAEALGAAQKENEEP